MLVRIQSWEDRCLHNLTCCSQPIPSWKAKIKTLPAVLVQLCFRDYQIPKAHFKVNLKERARLEKKSNRIQVFKKLMILLSINHKLHYVLQKYYLGLKLYFW